MDTCSERGGREGGKKRELGSKHAEPSVVMHQVQVKMTQIFPTWEVSASCAELSQTY
jgi:hypothetical protein